MGLLIIVLALCWAVGDGASNATSSVRDNYRTARDRRHQKADRRRKLAARGGGPAPRSASTGVKVASGATTIAVGGFLITRGFIDGFRAGWPKGKERARRWADTRKNGSSETSEGDSGGTPPPDGDGPAPLAKPSADDAGGKATVHVITSAPSATAPKTPAAKPGGGPIPTPASGGSAAMSINTVTGGEVHNFDQLLAELNAIAVEAHAELEDAQADAERANQDAQRIETMAGSLAELHLDRETLGKISALADASSTRLEAANARAVAAETRASGAMATAQHVQQTHQALAEAYASAPEGGAKKEFYTA